MGVAGKFIVCCHGIRNRLNSKLLPSTHSLIPGLALISQWRPYKAHCSRHILPLVLHLWVSCLDTVPWRHKKEDVWSEHARRNSVPSAKVLWSLKTPPHRHAEFLSSSLLHNYHFFIQTIASSETGIKGTSKVWFVPNTVTCFSLWWFFGDKKGDTP